MRIPVLVSAALLSGCIIVPHPHRHGHDHRDSWEEEESGRRGLTAGDWVFQVSDPIRIGNCDAVDLGDVEVADIAGSLFRDDEQLRISTDYGVLFGEQDGREVAAWGELSWKEEPFYLDLVADAYEQTALEGVVFAATGACLIEGSVVGELLQR